MIEDIIDAETKKFILAQKYTTKLNLLDEALKSDNFGFFMVLSRVLLDAPLSEGGVETETIESIRKKYYK